MKLHAFTLVVLALVSGLAAGCSESFSPATTEVNTGAQPVLAQITDPCGTPLWTALLAGQFIDAGSVEVANNDGTLCIQISTANGWMLTETHVAIEALLEDIPQTGSGNPQVGRFLLSAEQDPPVSYFEHCISLAEYGYQPGQTLYVAVHAIVQLMGENGTPIQEETAWADGEDFPGHNWATYITYTVQTCGSGEE
jgi:hypothetical protein